MPVLCPKCGAPVPMPSIDMNDIFVKAMDRIGPEKLAAMDKTPGQIVKALNALRLLNAKVNALAKVMNFDIQNDPDVLAAKKKYE